VLVRARGLIVVLARAGVVFARALDLEIGRADIGRRRRLLRAGPCRPQHRDGYPRHAHSSILSWLEAKRDDPQGELSAKERGHFLRSRSRLQKRSPDQVSSMAHTLLSTSPVGRISSRSRSSPRSVGTPEAFLGQAIHKLPSSTSAAAALESAR